MNSRISLTEYRAQARKQLNNQWGMNAWVIFLSLFLTIVIQSVFDGVAHFPDDSFEQQALNFLLGIFLFFAFTYALYAVALFVFRGGRARPSALTTIFQRRYYGSMFLLNILNTVVNWVVGAVVFLPIFLLSGTQTYLQLVVSNALTTTTFPFTEQMDVLFIVFLIIGLFLTFLLMTIVSGLFQFAIWVKLDHPELSIWHCLKTAWLLLSDRLGQYILLQLSFAGWYLVGLLALVVGLLWVIAYVNVTVAGFYEQSRKEHAALFQQGQRG